MTLDSWVLVPVVDLAVFARLDPDPPWAMISENLTNSMHGYSTPPRYLDGSSQYVQ